MRVGLGVMVGAVVGIVGGVGLFWAFPQAPVPDEPVALDIPSGPTQGDGGLTGKPVEAVAATEQFGWTDTVPQAEVEQNVQSEAEAMAPEPVPERVDTVAAQETMEWLSEEPVLTEEAVSTEEPVSTGQPVLAEEPVFEEPTVAESAPPQPQQADTTPQAQAQAQVQPEPVAPPDSAAPAGDPMVSEFARVSLITFDLADAYGPAIEAAKATGTDGVLRDELARETRIAIEEEFTWGFDAYVAFAQEVRRNPALESDVARAMAAMRP